MKNIVVAFLLCITGCTSMPDVQVLGLEHVKVTEHKVSQLEASTTCAGFMGIPAAMMWIALPLACARIYLNNWTCDIYYAAITESISLEHEREHCRGKWHDDGLINYRDAWRSNLERDI